MCDFECACAIGCDTCVRVCVYLRMYVSVFMSVRVRVCMLFCVSAFVHNGGQKNIQMHKGKLGFIYVHILN